MTIRYSVPFQIEVARAVPPRWLGDNMSGEYGALAVNDDWAATIYEYQRQYAPTLPALPTPTTGQPLPTTNGVNPNASDEYLAFTWSGAVERHQRSELSCCVLRQRDCRHGSERLRDHGRHRVGTTLVDLL